MFSVLLPSYNHSRYITECVASAISSVLVTEVIIVDDGSTDGSQDLFPSLKRTSPKIKILSSFGGNLGAHSRLNELVSAATNHWVAILNTDDLFVSGRFDAISRLRRASEIELIFGDLILINGVGKRLGFRKSISDNEFPWPDSLNAEYLASRAEWLPLLAQQNIAATTTNMIFTKSLHDKVGGFREYRYCHDWDFIIRAAMLPNRVSYSPTMLSKYRIHENNTIKDSRSKIILDVRRMFANIRRDFPQYFIDENFRNQFQNNRYLSGDGSIILELIVSDDSERARIEALVQTAKLPFVVTSPFSDYHESASFTCELNEASLSALTLHHLISFYLALALRTYDELLVFTRGPDQTSFQEQTGLNPIVIKRSIKGEKSSYNVRNVYLDGVSQAGGASYYPIGRPEQTDTAQSEGAPGPWPALIQTSLRSPILDGPRLPVIFVFPAFLAIGGVEKLVLDTIRLLSSSFQFVIVTTEPMRADQGSMHAEFHNIPIFDLPQIARRMDHFRALEMLKNSFEPDMIWICNGAPWQVSQARELRVLFSDIPIVDQMAYDHKIGWINAYENEFSRTSDRFVAINNSIRKAMRERFDIPLSKIDLIYHGTDLTRMSILSDDERYKGEYKRELGLDSQKPVFGMIGRLTSQKRPLDMIELAENFPSDNFVWVGLGELEGAFIERSTHLENVSLISARQDLVPIYRALDGIVILSEYEGLPLVMLEALAMGVPVLSSDVGAIKETLDHYGSGYCFGPAGNIDELLAAFGRFKLDLSMLKRRARSSSEAVKKDFSRERMASEYEACFNRAISEKNDR